MVNGGASYLGVGRARVHNLSNLERLRTNKLSAIVADAYLLINDDINFHTLLCLALKDPINAPLRIVRRRTA